ncbi:GNAT family N-acetyltransferase, partial [Aeromonas enteropelogenes]|uniref:GNAT family N-acetyltransferase n=1 Tax=Aeromonas enteropelogenes TaxID=29489 RepID=UPI003BA32E0E
MIRPLSTADLDAAVELWYQASIRAHHFIPASFWHAQRAAMRDIYLPASESWVYEEGSQLLGFVSYHQGALAALFITPNKQSQGLGRLLLEHGVVSQISHQAATARALGERYTRGFL